MPTSPAPLSHLTCSDGIRRAQLQEPELVELAEYGEFDGMMHGWLATRENDCAEGAS